ncbi:MAG TPA: hypothetical protein VMR29_04990, partial [Candidatus Binatia bacterium]|nr:hypothetical protein [Candidatus Binatia bacterium]
DPTVQAHVVDMLKEWPATAPPPATALPRLTVRRATGDALRIDADSVFLTVAKPFYKVGQPVEITVGARTATGHPFDSRSTKIMVRVEQIAHLGKRAAAVTVRVHADRKRPGCWVGSLRAPAAGSYRVSAVASHRWLAPFRICDFFEVDAGK